MTTYSFIASANSQFVNWNDPSVWAGGVVPDSADADVIFPTITQGGGGLYVSFVTISSGQNYAVRSVNITNNYLLLDGSLSVSNDLALQTGGEIDIGGTLSAGSLENDGTDIQGYGQINVAGTIANQTSIVGSGLTVTAAGLSNSGALIAASGNLTVDIDSGGFTNLSGSTVTGGTYSAGSAGNTLPNTLFLNIGGVITEDAADIEINGGGAIECYDSNAVQYVPLQSSLTSIAQGGTLSLENQTYNWGGSLIDDGALNLSYSVTLNLECATTDCRQQWHSQRRRNDRRADQ